MIDAGPALRAIVNPNGLGVSQMNENAPLWSRIPADDPYPRANWWAVHAFDRATSNEINKK
jgi:hypothetical protein